MADLHHINVVLIVFAMPGCPACEDYLPRFRRQVVAFQRYHHPFVFHTEGAPVASGTIPICVFDSASTDPGVQALADQHHVSALPTTVLATRYYGNERLEGALSDREIYDLLVRATQVPR